MKDMTKFNNTFARIEKDDKAIRDGLKTLDILFNRDRHQPLTEAGQRQDQHKKQALSVLKKMFEAYQVELKGAVDILFDVTARQDRVLKLAEKIKGGES